MSRPTSRNVTPAPPEKAPAQPLAAQPAPTAQATPPVPALRVAWSWRLVLFLWATSFVFLLLLEVLTAVFKVLARLF